MNRKVFTFAVIVIVVLSSLLSAVILFGEQETETYEETDIKIQVVVTIKNLGQAQANNIPLRLGIPLDHQPAQYVTNIVYSEQPERLTNDSWGNEYIHYTVLRLDPQAVKVFIIDLTFKMMSIDFNVQSANGNSIGPDHSRYLEVTPFINVNDPVIIDLAREIAEESDPNFVDISWNTYEWIIENIYYQQIPGEWDAATTLKNGEGGSAELGNLFVALLRANGIPARRLSGWGNIFEKGEELFLSRFAHGWAEFYMPSYGWIPVDPTWGKSHKFDYFAKSDPNHIVLTKGAGNHFFWRGPYDEPFGDTEIDTDYKLIVGDISVRNLSMKRDAISLGILGPPFILALFIIVKKLRQRRM